MCRLALLYARITNHQGRHSLSNDGDGSSRRVNASHCHGDSDCEVIATMTAAWTVKSLRP